MAQSISAYAVIFHTVPLMQRQGSGALFVMYEGQIMPDFEEKNNIENTEEEQSELTEDRKHHHKKFSYAKYMLTKKIPKRFSMIIGSEIAISLALYFGNQIGLFRGSLYFITLIAGLIGFWTLTWKMAKKDRRRTHKMRHYYICNVCAYCLFLLVAYIVYLNVSRTESFPDYDDLIFFPMFRLSLAFTLIDDGKIYAQEIPFSMSVFYGVTFALIMLEPVAAGIRHKLHALAKKHKKQLEMKRHQNKSGSI